jgi:hypothetical protein
MQVWRTDRYSKYAKYGNQRVKSVPSGGSHAEGIGGSMHTGHSALLEVMDHSRCRKVFTVQPHEQSPRRSHLAIPRAITRKKTSAAWMSSREITPQIPNRRTPRARFVGGRGFRRHLLSRCSVRAEIRDGKNQRVADMCSLISEGKDLTGRGHLLLCRWYVFSWKRREGFNWRRTSTFMQGGRKPAEKLKRRRHEETVTGRINLPPP